VSGGNNFATLYLSALSAYIDKEQRLASQGSHGLLTP